MDTDPFRVFLEMQIQLKRNAPSSDAMTRTMFESLDGLPQEPEMLFMGCGQGNDVLELLRCCEGRATAVDMLKPFLAKLEAKAEDAGITGDRLRTVCSDFEALDLPEGIFDLLWSEGAIYTLGFEEGLKAWAKYLKPGGFAVVSECTWLTDTPSVEAKLFWENAYPAMGTFGENMDRAKHAGFELLSTRVLPEEDWWTDYYQPLIPLIAEAREAYAGDPGVQAMLDEEETEIRLYERHAADYGYVFYVLRKQG
ncbi:MAG: class I SAM-dependent methyltransferase [Rhodobiaceae bacterium]|nr:class I SAM-dependent methyltransferase [Rhodobiaceae bacterium]